MTYTHLLRLAAIAIPFPAFSGIVAFDLGHVYSGVAPHARPPWLHAAFSDIEAGTVELRLQIVGLTGSEFVREWDFNIAGSQDLAALTITQMSGLEAVWEIEENGVHAAGGARFDLGFGFETSNAHGQRFTAGSAVFEISGPDWLTAQLFDAVIPVGAAGSARSAAHVNGIDKDSAWVSDSGAVPEPGTVLMVAPALLVAIVGTLSPRYKLMMKQSLVRFVKHSLAHQQAFRRAIFVRALMFL